jgi:nitroreductase
MTFSQPVTDLIRTRVSTRTYDGRDIDPAARQALLACLAEINGSQMISGRFILTGSSAGPVDQPVKLGTYGIITGARAYVVGLIDRQNPDPLTFGRLFETIVLCATDLGLQTCWLGGTFRKSDLVRQLSLSDQEQIAAVTPVGYSKNKPRLFESAMRAAVGANHRKPWSELFFAGDRSTPLDEAAAGAYAIPLEMVRLGPSASNKQPWRVIRMGQTFHFCLCRTPGYGLASFDLQLNDLGIAQYHFEQTALESGLSGAWQVRQDYVAPSGWSYLASWIEQR